MSTEISPQIRIFALVGVLVIVLAGGALLFLHHSKPAAVSVPPPQVKTATTATHSSTTPATTTHRTTAPATQSSTKPAASHVRHVSVDPLLPAPLRSALERHRVVVVGVHDAHAPTDSAAFTEARHGAVEAHVGWLPVDVLDNAIAGPLTALLPAGEVLPDPGILVYRRPGKLVFRFDGYLDRDAVAQAAVEK